MRKTITLIISSLALITIACEDLLLNHDEINPQSPKIYEARLATILDSLRYECDLPALAAAVITKNGIELAAVGSRRYGGPANITQEDKFHLGSCGKSFTSVLIGTLVDEGLVNWNTTLPEIFPEYENSMRDEYKTVTVQDLLSHGSGIMRDYSVNLKSSAAKDKRKEIVSWALQQKPAVQHGKYLYSNLAFIIAGAVAEKITNRTYEDLIMERVCIPLGLTTAGIGPMGTEGKEDQPLQHTPNHAPIIATPNAGLDPSYNPAGGLHMSVEDWTKYVKWVITCDSGGSQDILKKETAYKITAPITYQIDGWYYGMGWGVSENAYSGGKVIQHSGSNGFNYSTIWVAAKEQGGIIILTNQGAIGDEWLLEKPFNRLFDYYKKGI